MILQVSIVYAVGAIARLEQASHEVGSRYPGKYRFLKRYVLKEKNM